MNVNHALLRFFRALPQQALLSQLGTTPPASVGRITRISGDVRIMSMRDGAEREAEVGTVVYRGEIVVSAMMGEVHMGGDAELRLNDGTRILVTGSRAFVGFLP